MCKNRKVKLSIPTLHVLDLPREPWAGLRYGLRLFPSRRHTPETSGSSPRPEIAYSLAHSARSSRRISLARSIKTPFLCWPHSFNRLQKAVTHSRPPPSQDKQFAMISNISRFRLRRQLLDDGGRRILPNRDLSFYAKVSIPAKEATTSSSVRSKPCESISFCEGTCEFYKVSNLQLSPPFLLRSFFVTFLARRRVRRDHSTAPVSC